MATYQYLHSLPSRGGSDGPCRAGESCAFLQHVWRVAPNPRIYETPMNPNPIEYGVNKAGIRQMAVIWPCITDLLHVRCNSISPGPFPNLGIQESQPEFIERLSQKVPLGRVGAPVEIAGAVSFLLSDAASFITGIDLPVDGGWTVW